MYHTLKTKCLRSIEQNIDTPELGAFIKSDISISLNYRVGNERKNITLTRSEAPEFLKKHGIIAMTVTTRSEVKMYRKDFTTTPTKNGGFAMTERMVELEWSDLFLTPTEVRVIASHHEWGQLGKVIQFTNIIQAA